MYPDRLDALTRLGLYWRPSGEVGLRGPLLRLADDCDRAFRRIAALWNAREERHPATLPAAVLERVDYLQSFPQQATFPVHMDPRETNLDDFLAGPRVDDADQVLLTRLCPVSDVLTPAACYHVYAAHEGESFDDIVYLTTRNTCFRQESQYEPLRRLRSFTMREIVCLGNRSETTEFLAVGRDAVDLLLKLIDLPVEWLVATDCFFRTDCNPKYLFQRLQPVKHEATYGGDLAIGSANLHYDHFGVGFQLKRDGEPVNSACIAFGIERWLFAITDRHGTDSAAWPNIAKAAAKVCTAMLGATS
jgi:seryl-tRNA synthetase